MIAKGIHDRQHCFSTFLLPGSHTSEIYGFLYHPFLINIQQIICYQLTDFHFAIIVVPGNLNNQFGQRCCQLSPFYVSLMIQALMKHFDGCGNIIENVVRVGEAIGIRILIIPVIPFLIVFASQHPFPGLNLFQSFEQSINLVCEGRICAFFNQGTIRGDIAKFSQRRQKSLPIRFRYRPGNFMHKQSQ